MNTTEVSTLDFRNTNSLWCSVLVETLVRCGARQAVISPGSRSTPLTLAFARHPMVETIPVLDERSAAFFALGLSRQHRRATILVCTSGTAGANYFPAIIEAKESGVPLLVITADRPPEMRECTSGQTIDQQKLFGSHMNWYHELGVPKARLDRLRYVRQTLSHAWERTTLPVDGPVHLNAPFRDPLPPVEDGTAAALRGQIVDEHFFAMTAAPAVARTSVQLPALPPFERGLIVTGPVQPSDPDQYAGLVELLAHKTGWPVLADALSPLRGYDAPGQPFVACYDAIARNEALKSLLKPDFVLSLGGWPISKPLRAWLEALDVPTWIVSERASNLDALHGRARHICCGIEALVNEWPDEPMDGAFTADWLGAEKRARQGVGAKLASIDWLFEGKAAWLMAQHLPAETPVFVANSMPVRDLEYFWMPGRGAHRIHFNRGANGIDGTLSTALGVAHGSKPAVLLTGDLTLLHDNNGFLASAKLHGSLTIVLINNQGGGIFQHLPVAHFDPPFEELFATPQRADFAKLCSAYGVEHTRVADWAQFTALVSSLPASGVRVLEVKTDRKRDAAERKRLMPEIGAAAAEALE